MTITELKSYYLLEDAIRDTKERIAKIEAKLCCSSAFGTSGIPKNPTPRNHSEDNFIDLAYLKTELEAQVKEYEMLKVRIERYIASIPDLLIKRIMEKRVLEHKVWKNIAEELGGGNTKASVKMMYYRYISDNPG
ncbi:MAG: hypothetical protein ACI4KA_02615 [Oscillospiraceae bacterium]